MKFCVIKDTTAPIANGLYADTQFYTFALSAGFTKEHVEILTQEQYDARKALEPAPEVIDADTILNAKIEVQTINTLIDLGVI